MKNGSYIVMYDLEDNYICEFNSYEECARYFNTTKDVIQSYISKSKKGIWDKKLDKKHNRWVKLYKIKEEQNEI